MKNAIRERKSKVLGLFLCFLLLGIDYSFASYNNYSQFKTLSVSVSNSTLREVLKTIEKSSQFVFFYLDDAVNLERKVSIDSKNKNIEEILSELFEGTSCTYRISDRQIFISGKAPASTEQQQNKRKISGRVTDIKGEPLIGVNVTVDGDANGSITNMDGLYEIFVTKKSVVLKFTYIGFKTSEIRTNASTNIYDVTLEEQVNELEETVIVGYGTQRKISNIGAQSSMKMEDIKTPSASLTTTLAGRLAGVVAVQRTGEPGKDAADIWIRGISTPNTSSPLVLVDGVERSFNDIDPEDIESLTTLKDASATAVYGVRGANGVILITTKRGQLGKPKVTLRSEYAVLTGLRYPEYINAAEYAGLMNEARDNAGVANMAYTDEEIELFRNGSSPYLYPNVNWVDEVLKKNTTQSITNLNITGGTEVVRYFVNVGYTTQSGLYRDNGDNAYSTNSRVNRYNYRSRVDVNLTKDLSVELGVGGIIQNRNFPGKSQYDIFYAIRNTSPLAFPVKNPDGTPGASPTYLGNNPWGMTTQSGYETQNWNTLQGTFSARWDLSSLVTEGLSVSGRFAYDHYYSNNKQYYKDFEVKQYMGEDAEGNAIYNILRNENIKNVTLAESANRAIYYEVAANYDRTFGMHNITGMFLFNRRDYVNLRNTDRTGSVPYRRQGIAGRASYNYLQRYFAEFNFGYNGSEQFPKGKRYGFFPSVSLGYVLTNEDFWNRNWWISNLKLRGSYGTVGNDISSSTRFLYLTTMNMNVSAGYMGKEGNNYMAGIMEGQTGNQNVTWETAKKLNVGFDLGLFNDVVSLQVDIFKEKRDGILITRKTVPVLAGFSGASIPVGNLGKAENKGIETALEVKKRVANGLFYSLRGNFSFARNKIIENDEPKPKYEYQDARGRRIDQTFGLVALGFFKDQDDIKNSPKQTFQSTVRPGDIKYKDINGDGVVDEYDKVAIGDPRTPEIMFGFGGTVAYKNFDVSLFFTGAAKTSFFLEGATVYPFLNGEGTWNVLREVYDNRWTSETAATAKYPIVLNANSYNNYQTSTMYMRNGSYLRLKSAEIGYTFKGRLIDKMFMDNIRLFCNGQNLLTLDYIKIVDPESNNGVGNYPMQRTINFGFQINFK